MFANAMSPTENIRSASSLHTVKFINTFLTLPDRYFFLFLGEMAGRPEIKIILQSLLVSMPVLIECYKAVPIQGTFALTTL